MNGADDFLAGYSVYLSVSGQQHAQYGSGEAGFAKETEQLKSDVSKNDEVDSITEGQ